MLECTFVGHQTWHFRAGDDSILFDPLLMRGFGHSRHIEFEVYPPREVEVDAMPAPQAVFLSHEHLDHFHIPSLDKLLRSVPVCVGPTMPSCITDAVSALGFRIIELPHYRPLRFGRLEVSQFPCAVETIFWEKRVVQYFIRDTQTGSSCFLAVDADSCSDIRDRVLECTGSEPDLVVMSNNSMRAPPRGSYLNGLTSVVRPDYGPSAGLDLLKDIISAPITLWGRNVKIAICGDGHVDHQKEFGPFMLSDNKVLAGMINSLAARPMAYGPYPGDMLVIESGKVSTSKAPWIALKVERHSALKAQLAAFLVREDSQPAPIVPLLGTRSGVNAIKEDLMTVEDFLPELARSLLMSDAGTLAVRVTTREWGRLSPRRILLRLLTGDGRCVQYGLNVRTCQFEADTTSASELMRTFPIGFEMFLGDLAGILRGQAQFWDVSARATRSWQMGNALFGVEAVLLQLLGEQVRPDLHAKLFSDSISRLRSEGSIAG